jgi:hypothetical protein
LSRKIDHRIWECPPHLFGRNLSTRFGVRLVQNKRVRSCNNTIEIKAILCSRNASPRKAPFVERTRGAWCRLYTLHEEVETLSRGLVSGSGRKRLLQTVSVNSANMTPKTLLMIALSFSWHILVVGVPCGKPEEMRR